MTFACCFVSDISSKLAMHPKVLCTPHLGASTVEAQKRVAKEIAEQIVDASQGKSIIGLVRVFVLIYALCVLIRRKIVEQGTTFSWVNNTPFERPLVFFSFIFIFHNGYTFAPSVERIASQGTVSNRGLYQTLLLLKALSPYKYRSHYQYQLLFNHKTIVVI